MNTAVASVHNLIVALHNEVHASIEAALVKEPATALFNFRGSQFKKYLAELSPSESREVASSAFFAHTSQVSLRRITRDCYYFFEPLPSDADLFKLVVVIRRPGMLDAIIEGCADKLYYEMVRYDVDEPQVTVEYAPLSIYSVLYPRNDIAGTYYRHVTSQVTAKVAERFAPHRVEITNTSPGIFECRRL